MGKIFFAKLLLAFPLIAGCPLPPSGPPGPIGPTGGTGALGATGVTGVTGPARAIGSTDSPAIGPAGSKRGSRFTWESGSGWIE